MRPLLTELYVILHNRVYVLQIWTVDPAWKADTDSDIMTTRTVSSEPILKIALPNQVI